MLKYIKGLLEDISAAAKAASEEYSMGNKPLYVVESDLAVAKEALKQFKKRTVPGTPEDDIRIAAQEKVRRLSNPNTSSTWYRLGRFNRNLLNSICNTIGSLKLIEAVIIVVAVLAIAVYCVW